jgi:diguanylate cyclase (GGDEF)-like protein/PAS domain S-box-containing protein
VLRANDLLPLLYRNIYASNLHWYRCGRQDAAMDRTTRESESWVAIALAVAVFCAGLAFACTAYSQRAADHQQKVADDFEDRARQYAFLVQRQLDAYAATSQTLAGYVATSNAIDSKNFAAFIRAAHYFDGLAGLSSLGYLPRVAHGDAPAFEQRAAREFPGFKIRAPRAGADVYYPLLYGMHARGVQRTDRVRGIDFSGIPERLAAIRSAQANNAAAVTPLLPALLDGTPMLFTFTPARTLREAAGRDEHGGMVYAAMNVRALFEGIDNGRLARLFALEVYQVSDGRKLPIYNSDDVLRASEPPTPGQYMYAQELRYADQALRLYFFARPQYIETHADRHSKLVLATALLLSLVVAWATFMFARRYLRRQGSVALDSRLHALFEAHPFSACAIDREGRLVFANQKMARELGIGPEQLVGVPVERFLTAACRQAAAASLRDALAGQAVVCQTSVVNANGGVSESAVVLVPIAVRGEVTRVLGFAENITERKRFERELYESRQKLQLVLDTVPMRVFWKNRDSVYLGANRRLLDEAGLDSVEQLVGCTDDDLVWRAYAQQYRGEDKLVMDSGMARHNDQWSHRAADGSTRWLEVSKMPLTDDSGAVVGLLGVAHDITERKQMEAELTRRANHDSLTGLPNRSFFYAELQQAIKRAPRQGQLAVLYFDIDHFKRINDTWGHDAGDEVIRIFGRRVRATLREADFVARLGGDEFVVIVEGLALRADAAQVAEKLVAAMQAPFPVGERGHAVSTSIGIAFLEEGMAADQLIKAADDAMYEAKRAGRNCFRAAPAVQE